MDVRTIIEENDTKSHPTSEAGPNSAKTDVAEVDPTVICTLNNAETVESNAVAEKSDIVCYVQDVKVMDGDVDNFSDLQHVTETGTSLGESIQIVTVPDAVCDETVGQLQLFSVAADLPSVVHVEAGELIGLEDTKDSELQVRTDNGMSVLLRASTIPCDPPHGLPPWATRLRDCEKIGDSYRGWVSSEVELDLVLGYHRHYTQSVWGTRQSSSPANLKPPIRLMWKSQYCPFDGIPFLNVGSRAVVQECQYGPRRKGTAKKKDTVTVPSAYRQTCPARIYIKRVIKFPQYKIDTSQDKKSLRYDMDAVFAQLKPILRDIEGENRWYVQLPTETEHQFHSILGSEEHDEKIYNDCDFRNHRLHPKVAEKIRELVSHGETRVYAIRKHLRKFVESMFSSRKDIPQRHNLCFFPTIHDLQNHIHEALNDIKSGRLDLKSDTMTVEVQAAVNDEDSVMWQTVEPRPETLTVTLSDKKHGSRITKVRAQMSDGTVHVTSSLTPQMAQWLSKLPVFNETDDKVKSQQVAAVDMDLISGEMSMENECGNQLDERLNLPLKSFVNGVQESANSNDNVHSSGKIAQECELFESCKNSCKSLRLAKPTNRSKTRQLKTTKRVRCKVN